MDEARNQGSAGNDSLPPRVFGAALGSGLLLASLVAVAAWYETGFPPGVTPPPFARLIGQPAPAFSLGGLQGATVSPVDAPAGGAWVLFFAEASCQARDAVLAQASQRYPVIVVGAGDRAVLQEKLAPHGLVPVAGHDSRWEVNQAYGVPSVLLIDPQGVVRNGAVGSQAWSRCSPSRTDRAEHGGAQTLPPGRRRAGPRLGRGSNRRRRSARLPDPLPDRRHRSY